MLIQCKECNHKISDKAYACPNCGFPLKSFTENSTRGKSRKKKRLPNGFGQITKIKGNLRNPYRAMVTVGKTETGKPICKLLKPQSYFKTYNDAYAALVEYNKSPYEISPNLTCNEIYNRWIEEYEQKVSASMYKNMKCTWNHCKELHNEPINNIRVRHLKMLLKDCNVNTKKRIKTLWNHLMDYAVEYEIIEKNYARMFSVNEKQTTINDHIVFTKEEMKTLWKNKEDTIVAMILIQCFMGWRPQELCNISIHDVDLDANTITGGMKTSAGEKRIVYVLPAIQSLVEKQYVQSKNIDGTYLFLHDSKPLDYWKYRWRFTQVMSRLNMNTDHRPHDPRKHFITVAKRANVNEYAIKKIVGHEISDITEKIYTERDPEWLKNEMLKIESCMNSV